MLLTSRQAASSSTSCKCSATARRHGVALPVAVVGANDRRRSRSSSASCSALPRGEDADLLLSGCPVPPEQQPMNELKQLQEMYMFDLATMPVGDFGKRLAAAWAGFFLAAGLPVSCFTFNLQSELPQCLAAACAGSCFVVTVLVWRLYLGWQHVGDRLISATVEYEETGWYDGQTWVKTPAVLMRDRLMSNYTVKPALARLKQTLLGLGGALAACMLLLGALPPPPGVMQGGGADATSYSSYSDTQYGGGSTGGGGGQYSSEAVERYESWAVQQGANDGDAGPRYDMRTHMMAQQ